MSKLSGTTALQFGQNQTAVLRGAGFASEVHPPREDLSTPRLLATVEEAQRILGIKRTTLYSLLGENRLRAVKLNRRTLITMESIHELLATLPTARIAAQKRAA